MERQKQREEGLSVFFIIERLYPERTNLKYRMSHYLSSNFIDKVKKETACLKEIEFSIEQVHVIYLKSLALMLMPSLNETKIQMNYFS